MIVQNDLFSKIENVGNKKINKLEGASLGIMGRDLIIIFN